ncbi:hypothetical protein [Streptomyces kaempferi]|uniref:ATP synthase F0 subunit B n=1 Tax=Streptomyces kaempferi TaxID=333725 RepID=A0ABW3XMH3_9ACTN
MSLRDFLERFRPTGTPGAAATGVPADRTAERAAELDPALEQLTGVRQEAARIRAAADGTAEVIRREAAREAASMVAVAREQAPEVRRQTAVPVVESALREADVVRAAGVRGADEVRAQGRERMSALVDRAVADALRLATGTGTVP